MQGGYSRLIPVVMGGSWAGLGRVLGGSWAALIAGPPSPQGSFVEHALINVLFDDPSRIWSQTYSPRFEPPALSR